MRQTEKILLIDQLLPIVRAAGNEVMRVYIKRKISVKYKEDSSPVTEADLVSQRLLVSELPTLLFDCPVVSEEDPASQIYRQKEGLFWLIDPLDGTKEFLSQNGEFTVNTALIKDGRSILGVIYAPAIDALYWGGADFGAWRCIHDNISKIKVSSNKIQKPYRVLASKSHLNQATQSLISSLGEVKIFQAGSSLKFCRVAEGTADIYPRLAPTCEWDTAAGQAILEGAGGLVIDLENLPLLYGKPNVVNPSFIAICDKTLLPA